MFVAILVIAAFIMLFFEHFARITVDMNAPHAAGGLWDPDDEFFYDVLHVEHGSAAPYVGDYVAFVQQRADFARADQRAVPPHGRAHGWHGEALRLHLHALRR